MAWRACTAGVGNNRWMVTRAGPPPFHRLGSTSFFFPLTHSKFSKSTQDLCLEKWAIAAYKTVHPHNAGHMAKTRISHVYTRGLSCAVAKTATP